ncbi:hypothetical protein MASR2M78_03950 [Treponema sp.]
MTNVMNRFEILSTRAGFNSAVRHIKSTISYIDSIAVKENLADILASPENIEEMNSDKLSALLRMLIVDKMAYSFEARNLETVVEDLPELAEEFSKWNAVDMILAYHHPDIGLVIANPKSKEQLGAFGSLRKRELAVAYVGKLEKGSDALCTKACSLILGLLEGSKVKIPEELYKGEFGIKKPKKDKAVAAPKKASKTVASKKSTNDSRAAPAAQTAPISPSPLRAAAPAPVSGGSSRMTPQYSVIVQNELFHNGNVEAWKRIIDSYKTKYPTLEVFIYYDGERIMDINSLFKWGKVKHGSAILFAVAGSEIKDVAKLQRYLMQGASPLFEAFLHGPVHTALKLF